MYLFIYLSVCLFTSNFIHVMFLVSLPPTQKKKKAKKDANAPKRPVPAYMLWLGDNRTTLKEENASADNKELMRIAGAKWRELAEGLCVALSFYFKKEFFFLCLSLVVIICLVCCVHLSELLLRF